MNHDVSRVPFSDRFGAAVMDPINELLTEFCLRPHKRAFDRASHGAQFGDDSRT